MTNKRYYYTDPIKALYMMKEFGVTFIVGDQGYYKYEQCLPYTLEHLSKRKKFYIAKKSEHIFKAKHGDDGKLLNVPLPLKCCKKIGITYWACWEFLFKRTKFNYRLKPFATVNEESVKIIYRDNKQFFFPEVEHDK
jgi:hypothetical protein